MFVRLDVAKYSFNKRAVSEWNAVNDEIIECRTLSCLKNKFDNRLTVLRFIRGL